jgi:hypothetical protein
MALGVALIVIQSVLTAALAICIAVNAIYVTCKENPHIRKRKEMEKQRDADLTPLNARNSLLGDPLYRGASDGKGRYSQTPTHDSFNFNDASGQGSTFPLHHMTPAPQHTLHGRSASGQSSSGVRLMDEVAPLSYVDTHDRDHAVQYDEFRHQQPPSRGNY